MRSSLLIVAMFLGMVACEKADEGPNGVGPWNFKRSRLADAEAAGRCMPIEGGFVQCIGLTSMGLGGQDAHVQLYFKSADKNAPLMEISLSVKTCQPPAVAADLIARIGEPKDRRDGDKTLFWSLPGMFVRALVPEKGSGECLVTFVSPADKARIEDLQKGS
jgi:hypothetical protein